MVQAMDHEAVKGDMDQEAVEGAIRMLSYSLYFEAGDTQQYNDTLSYSLYFEGYSVLLMPRLIDMY